MVPKFFRAEVTRAEHRLPQKFPCLWLKSIHSKDHLSEPCA